MTDLGRRVHAALKGLSPGYFAMVMATGIVSVGLHAEQHATVSEVLLVLAVAGFVGLLMLNAWRFVAHRHELAWDFTHPLRGFGFYTFVAAADVLAVRVAPDHRSVALWLMVVAGISWLVRGYVVPWTTRLGAGEHPIVAAANGTWFMWAVAGQSVAVAAAVLASYRSGDVLPFVALGSFAVGCVLYVVDGVFVAMRLMAYEFSAADLTPPYWIAMGAAAITSLAGTEVAHLPAGPFGDVARETVHGGAVLAWFLASWLVPALFAMGWWRHITHGIRLRYTADLWSIVFPLGMYGVASTTLAREDDLPWLGTIGSVGTGVALVAWVMVAVMAVHHVVRDVLLG